MGIMQFALDDGNMDEINEEQEPEEQEPTEPGDPIESGDSTVEAATTWTVDVGPDADESDEPDVADVQDADVEDTFEADIEETVEAEFDLGDTLEAEVDAGVVGDEIPEEPVAQAYVPPIPPAPQPVPQYDRLTRDPFATFGGVLSGIAHRYGWDVSLTRLAFVVLLIVSGGTALFAYFLAWLIIPRASHWPPVRVSTNRSRLSGRDLGIGLIGLGALVVLGIGSGEAAAVLVPLALVGGGIWLLLQNPRDGEALSPAGAVGSMTDTATPYVASAPVGQQSMPAQPGAQPMNDGFGQSVPTQPPVAPAPVPKRSRLRRFGIIGVFGFLALALLSIIAVPLIFFAIITDGDFDINVDDEYLFRPANVAEIQHVITEDAGEIILDLRSVDFDSIDPTDTPVDIDVDLDVGRIEVLVPQDVRVSVDAEADLGDVTVFGRNDDGINPSRVIISDEPQLDLEVDLNVGEIVVRRGNVSSTTIIEVN